MENYGVLSLLPVAVVIVLVFLTKRTTVSLLAGTLVGAVMLYGVHFAKPWLEVVYGVMGSELWIWLVLVCGFFGSLVALFEASGGIYGFTDIAAKICKGEKRTLLAGWLLGIVTFVDDWLSILSVGTAMRRATDRFHIPREMLAFLSNATASSICVIVPTSTWGVFMISQLVATGVCPSEAGWRPLWPRAVFVLSICGASLRTSLRGGGSAQIWPHAKRIHVGATEGSPGGADRGEQRKETQGTELFASGDSGHWDHHCHRGDSVWDVGQFGVLRPSVSSAEAYEPGKIFGYHPDRIQGHDRGFVYCDQCLYSPGY